MASTNNKNHKSITVRFDLDNDFERELYEWVKAQGNMTKVGLLGFQQLKQQYGDGDLLMSMSQMPVRPQLPQGSYQSVPQAPQPIQSVTYTQSSVEPSNTHPSPASGLQNSFPQSNDTDVSEPDLSPTTKSPGAKPSRQANADDEVNDSPFGGLSTGFGDDTSNDVPSDGGDWRKQI